MLLQAIEQGGSTLRDYAGPDGQLGYFAHSFEVYGREGLECRRCAAQADDLRQSPPVRRIVQGGRSTWYCPKCQT